MNRDTHINLTVKAIKPLRYDGNGKHAIIKWDTAVRGFGLRIYPGGQKAFILRYRFQGERRFMTLGDFGILTPIQARELARRELSRVAEGIDPLTERRTAMKGETFRDLAKAYIEDHAKPHKRTWREDKRRLDKVIPKHWRSRKVKSFRHEEIGRLHRQIGQERGHYEANRVLALLHSMFRLAAEWGYMEKSTDNPAAGVKKFQETKRKRFVSKEELPPLASAIDEQENIYIRAALWLLILTGCRKSELLSAKHRDIDRTGARLRLPMTKAGEEQSIPLSAPAMAIIQATPRLEGNPYLLPGRRAGRPLVNIDKPWREVREAAGLDDVRLHDLRRSVGSWMTQSNVDLNTIKAALRHADLSTTLTYARLGPDPARQAFEDHGKQIMEIAGKVRPAVSSSNQKT